MASLGGLERGLLRRALCNVNRGALAAPSPHEASSLGFLRSFVAFEIFVLCPIHSFVQGLGRVSQLMTLSRPALFQREPHKTPNLCAEE